MLNRAILEGIGIGLAFALIHAGLDLLWAGKLIGGYASIFFTATAASIVTSLGFPAARTRSGGRKRANQVASSGRHQG